MSNAEAVCKSNRAFAMQDQAGAPEPLRHIRTHLNALCFCSHEREGICDALRSTHRLYCVSAGRRSSGLCSLPSSPLRHCAVLCTHSKN